MFWPRTIRSSCRDTQGSPGTCSDRRLDWRLGWSRGGEGIVPDEPVSLGSNTGSVGEAISGLWEAIVEIGRVVGYAGAWSDYASGSLDSLNNIVFPRLSEARALQDAGFHGAAVVSAYTAIELTLETVVVRPFVLAGFMTEDLARVFADRILRAPVVEHRKMVSGLARVIGVDLGSLQLADGTALWDYL